MADPIIQTIAPTSCMARALSRPTPKRYFHSLNARGFTLIYGTTRPALFLCIAAGGPVVGQIPDYDPVRLSRS